MAPNFVFGCQTHEGGLFRTQQADGIIGIGQGERSFVRALWAQGALAANMFSLCTTLDTAAFSVGGVAAGLHSAPPAWAKLSLTSFYVVAVESLALLPAPGAALAPLPLDGLAAGQGTILDSGTTFTYLPGGAFDAIESAARQAGAAAGLPPATVDRKSVV